MRFKSVITLLIACIITITLIPIKVSADILDKEMFDKLSIDEGLSNEQVTTIFQDSKGYIWIGTKDGLNRFDGERIKIYNYSNDGKQTLSSTCINAIEEDYYGNMWIGTDNGLDILLRDTDTIIRVKDLNRNKMNPLGEVKITVLLQSNYDKNIMWVGTEKGLMKVDIEGSKIEDIYSEYENENKLTNSYITYLNEGKTEDILCVGTAYGINTIDLVSNIVYNTYNFSDEKLYIYDIEKDSNNNIWVLTKENIIFFSSKEEEKDFIWTITDGDIKKINLLTGEEKNIYKNYGNVKVRNAQSILIDSNDNIWMSSDEGIVIYSIDEKKWIL